jgi:hypothetical protein
VSLDPRGLVWLLIVLLGAYVIYQLLRARPQAPQQSAVEPTPGADAAPADAPVEPRERPAERLQADMLRVEMVKLREDLEARLAAQQRDIARLETELAELRTQLERVESASKVSPQYGEAMIFARRGLAPDAIAERCGISVAEAQLVLSLVSRGDGQDEIDGQGVQA